MDSIYHVKLSDNIMDVLFKYETPTSKGEDPYENRKPQEIKKVVKDVVYDTGLFYEKNINGVALYYKENKNPVMYLTKKNINDGDTRITINCIEGKDSGIVDMPNFFTKKTEINKIKYMDNQNTLILQRYGNFINYNNTILKLDQINLYNTLGTVYNQFSHSNQLIINYGDTCLYGSIVQFLRHDDEFIKKMINTPIHLLDPFVVSVIFLFILMGDNIIIDGYDACSTYLKAAEPDIFLNIFDKKDTVEKCEENNINKIFNIDKEIIYKKYYYEEAVDGKREYKYFIPDKWKSYVFSYIYIYIYARISLVTNLLKKDKGYIRHLGHGFNTFISSSYAMLSYYYQEYIPRKRDNNAKEFILKNDYANIEDRVEFFNQDMYEEYYIEERKGDVIEHTRVIDNIFCNINVQKDTEKSFYLYYKEDGKELTDKSIGKSLYNLIGYIGNYDNHFIYIKIKNNKKWHYDDYIYTGQDAQKNTEPKECNDNVNYPLALYKKAP